MIKFIYVIAAFLFILSACEYDNYEPPTSKLSGRIVYEGTPVGVRHDVDVLQLYEPGWENFAPINVHVNQDGTFSSALFDGDYKLVLVPGNGPWANQLDSIDVQVRGSATIDIPVEPFFWIENETFNIEDNTLSASFDLKQIDQNSGLQFVSLFIGKTRFVGNRFKMKESRTGAAAVGDLNSPINLEMDLSDISQDYIFARIGVKTRGSAEFIFSPVQKLETTP
jgi:hypothetical protein